MTFCLRKPSAGSFQREKEVGGRWGKGQLKLNGEQSNAKRNKARKKKRVTDRDAES